MSTGVSPAPVKQSIVVEAPIERAFKVFTEDFGSFKPREHNLLAVPIAETVFEPRVGGHIFDRGVDDKRRGRRAAQSARAARRCFWAHHQGKGPAASGIRGRGNAIAL